MQSSTTTGHDFISKMVGRDGSIRVTQDIVDECAEFNIDRMQEAGVPSEDVELYLLEWRGGNCVMCSKPYKRVHHEIKSNGVGGRGNPIGHVIADFVYWRPTCKCISDRGAKDDADRKVKSRLRAAKIPKRLMQCTLNGWDHGVQDKTNEAFKYVHRYCKRQMFRERGLILYGDVGTGKTHCAVAAMRIMAEDGMSIRYIAMSSLVQDVIRGGSELLEELMSADAVLFDDMDKIGTTNSPWVRERIFSLVDTRMANDRIVLGTTNFMGHMQFVEKFGEAVVSRLIGKCELYLFEGDDYRLKQREMSGKP